MAYTDANTVQDPTSGERILSAWGDQIRTNQEDHESRIGTIEGDNATQSELDTVEGRVVRPRLIPFSAGSGGFYYRWPTLSFSSFGFSDGEARLAPLWLPPGTIRELACDVVTIGSAGALTRLVLYSPISETDVRPGALLVDAGTVATDDAPGMKVLTVSQAFAGGLVWAAAINQGGASTRASLRFGTMIPGPLPMLVKSATTIYGAWQKLGITGAPPDPVGNVSGVQDPPFVFVKVAP